MRIPFDCQFVVDCEYENSTHSLISMAIVPLWPADLNLSSFFEQIDEEREFYEVVSPLPLEMSDWVRENVVPRLEKPGISFQSFQEKLQTFLLRHRVQELHYDWCEDIAYFNRALVTGPGERLKIPPTRTSFGKAVAMLSHVHHTDIEYNGTNNHNALSDARLIAAAIRCRLLGY